MAKKINWLDYSMEDIERESKKEKFTAISLFAGVGGGCIGAKLAGGKLLAINEFIEEAQRVYKINFPNTRVVPDDVRQVNGKKLLASVGLKVGELDLLMGSPPCSSFSTVGKREEGWGEVKAYSDTKQRTDDLFPEFARLLTEMQPKFFVAENVASLLEGKAKYLFGSEQLDMFGEQTNGVAKQEDTFFHQLTSAGYNIRYEVLNSKDFGVPQSRKRLIIVGVRNDINHRIKFPIPTTHNHITLSEAFSGLINTEDELEEANIEKYAIYQASLDTPRGAKSTKYFSLIKQSPDKYAGTLTQTAGCLSAASIVHWDNRKFTVAESIKIMGFPKDIYLGDTYPNKIERLGRAITPSVYYYVISLLFKTPVKSP
jgi:DNA (cytosine-5)-methyltransferase 1